MATHKYSKEMLDELYREHESSMKIDKELKSLNKRLNLIEESNTLKEQTHMFWNLQLHFFELDAYHLKVINLPCRFEIPLQQKFSEDFTEDERLEYATELALYLSGLK